MTAEPAEVASLAVHPMAALVPEQSEPAYQQILGAIQRHGQQDPIVIAAGQIVDGRARYRACLALGLDPLLRDFDPEREGDPLAFVLRSARATRALAPGQWAALGVGVSDYLRGVGSGSGVRGAPRQNAALLCAIPMDWIRRAGTVQRRDPALFAQLQQGTIAPAAAYRRVKAPYGEQAALWQRRRQQRRRQQAGQQRAPYIQWLKETTYLLNTQPPARVAPGLRAGDWAAAAAAHARLQQWYDRLQAARYAAPKEPP